MTRAANNPKRATKFSGQQIDTIRQLRNEGQTLRALAATFGTGSQYIHDICSRRVWRET